MRLLALAGGTAGLLLAALGASPTAQAQTKAMQPVTAPSQQVIDLPAVLRLAGTNNLDLALVREALVQAQAENEAARLRFFPWISPSVGFGAHNGVAQDASGNIVEANKKAYGGDAALVSGVSLGEAIYRKLAASRLQTAARYGVDAQRSDTAFAAAFAYFELVNAGANMGIAREAVRISRDYEQQVERAVAIGLASRSDQLRVSVQTQSYQVALRQTTERERNAAANLAQVLHLDPAVELAPADGVAPQIVLVSLDTPLDSLVAMALAARPELRRSAESVAAADLQRREALYAPLVPSITAQATYGGLGGGRNGSLAGARDFEDFALMLNWRIGPGGLFDRSRIDLAQSKLEQARLGAAKLHDEIAREVVEAYEAVHSARDQGDLAGKNVELAQQSLDLSLERRQFGVGAVLEVIQAQKDLTQARIDFARATTQYAEAQHALAHAVAQIGF